ncbi:MAG TPA: hypothetical protein VEQ35_02310 [Beijerinckia sp.]|jgi:hypothetical protein|nr:hypothetical protein [Beijerinckia sp.]
MWNAAKITIEIEQAEGSVMIVNIHTPLGTLDLVGEVKRIGRILYVDRAHVQGLKPGALGRDGLNAIGRKLLKEADVDKIVVYGGVRTTGKGKGRRPQPIHFPKP